MKSVSPATRLLRRWIPSLALTLALGVNGCGGGNDTAVGTSDGVKRAALAAVAASEADQAKVVAVSQVSEKRISRTVFEYVFNVTVLNAPPYGEAANAAEWDFSVPVAGIYELFAEYAAVESRPVNIAFNGTVRFANALSAVTGGWFPANRQTISQGIVTLAAGATTMRVSRSSLMAT